MAGGAGIKQTIVIPAGLPGQANSVYSELQTVQAASSATTVGRTVITDVGLLLFMPLADATTSLKMQTAASTWTSLGFPSTTVGGAWFSDGTNLAFENTVTTTTKPGTYYIIQ
jgi:hypothetical protein